MNILFVCTGNTCRSPMAEAICRALLEEKEVENVTVSSAGLHAEPMTQTTRLAVQALHDIGIELEPKKAVQIYSGKCEEADLIAVMTENHAAAVERLCPGSAPKIRILHVDDPYGGDLDEYEDACGQLKREVKRLLKKEKIL